MSIEVGEEEKDESWIGWLSGGGSKPKPKPTPNAADLRARPRKAEAKVVVKKKVVKKKKMVPREVDDLFSVGALSKGEKRRARKEEAIVPDFLQEEDDPLNTPTPPEDNPFSFPGMKKASKKKEGGSGGEGPGARKEKNPFSFPGLEGSDDEGDAAVGGRKERKGGQKKKTKPKEENPYSFFNFEKEQLSSAKPPPAGPGVAGSLVGEQDDGSDFDDDDDDEEEGHLLRGSREHGGPKLGKASPADKDDDFWDDDEPTPKKRSAGKAKPTPVTRTVCKEDGEEEDDFSDDDGDGDGEAGSGPSLRAPAPARGSGALEAENERLKKELARSQAQVRKLKQKEKDDTAKMEAMLMQVERKFAQAQMSHQQEKARLERELQIANERLLGGDGLGDGALRKQLNDALYSASVTRQNARMYAGVLSQATAHAEKQLQQLVQGCSSLRQLAAAIEHIERVQGQHG